MHVGNEIEGVLDHIENDHGIGLLHAFYLQNALHRYRELVPVRACYPRDGIALTGHIEHPDDLRKFPDGLLDIQNVALRVYLDYPHELEAHAHVVHFRPVAFDYPLGFQILHPLDQGGRMYAQLLRQLPVGTLTGNAHELDYAPVCLIEIPDVGHITFPGAPHRFYRIFIKSYN
ncbi:hypothetical protein SDC9_119492 [bioreactor metagenome]|uniref:Uncharacterized protein n=1 Tax=bioreactor metagenome TaxID=1076179 RepID=A0A645C3Y5_9ZZZZ